MCRITPSFDTGFFSSHTWEYTGNDYDADMTTMGADPTTQAWWKITAPLQKRVPEVIDHEWWHSIPEVFHMD
jgi:L-rhamnose mutarotase